MVSLIRLVDSFVSGPLCRSKVHSCEPGNLVYVLVNNRSSSLFRPVSKVSPGRRRLTDWSGGAGTRTLSLRRVPRDGPDV